MNILNDISAVYLDQIAESAVPGKPAEKLKTDRHMFNIPKSEQEAARERILAKTKAKREKMKEETEIEEASYSAKAARAGKDIGKPGKQFAKIAKSAAERYGSEERGKKVAGAVLAKLRKEALDPVGQEDADIDNDGDTDKSDKYLHNRRKAVGKAIAKKKGMKEGFSNWRQDLSEVMDDVEANKEIKEKKVNNKIKINPEMKEAVEQLGGELIEMVEVDEAKQPFPAKKVEKQMEKARKGSVYAKKGNPAVPNTSDDEKKNTNRYSKMFHASEKAKREKQEADKARRSSTFYKDTHPASAPKMKKANEEIEHLDEKAVSKQQQKFMGMVYAVKKGEMKAPSSEVAKAAAGMTKQQAKDFAKTKHKGLPQVKEQMNEPLETPSSKAGEMEKKKIQIQKIRDLTIRLQSAKKGVY